MGLRRTLDGLEVNFGHRTHEWQRAEISNSLTVPVTTCRTTGKGPLQGAVVVEPFKLLLSGSIWDVLSRNRLREFRLGAGALHDPSHVPRPDFFGGRLYKRSRRQSQRKVTSDSSRMRVARSVVAGLGCSFLRTSGQASCRALAEGSDIRCASIASLHGDV